MNIKQMIESKFEGCREAAAKACGISIGNLNMCISRKYEVSELETGDFIMLTSKTKIFKVNKG